MVDEEKYILLSIIVSGAAVMALELGATRVLTPYFGSTIYVLTSAIAVTLVLLALGYSFWGKFADKRPKTDFMAKLMIAAGVAALAIPLAAFPLMRMLEFLGPRWGAFASSLALLGVPMFCLGGLVPYAVRLLAKNLGRVGGDSGRVFSVSTIGSLVGTLAVGFYLIPMVGTANLFYLTSALLIATGGGWLLMKGKKAALALGVIFFLAISFQGGESSPELIYWTESAYGDLRVIDTARERCLLQDGAPQSCFYKGDSGYYDYITLISDFAINISARKVLSIGLGAGDLSSRLVSKGVDVLSVEIDGKVVDIAREYFGFAGEVVIADGRRFMRTSGETYDLVVIDAYSGYSPVEHLHSKEAFETAKGVLNEGGALSVNIVGFVSEEKDRLRRAVYSTLKAVFKNVYVVSMGSGGVKNIVFFASDKELPVDSSPLGEGEIITDDRNLIKIYATDVLEEDRNFTLTYYGQYLT